ncbi:lactonase family protein [Achromobacter aloeverae]
MASRYALYAAIGRLLLQFDLDTQDGTLARRAAFELPEGLQYLWRHASLPILYAACSDGRPKFEGTRHCLCALRMRGDGSLAPEGEPIPLPVRPVHVATDSRSRYAFVTSAHPSRVDVFEIDANGRLGAPVPQQLPDLPKTAHQLLLTPDDSVAVLPLRGNDASGQKAEDPGAVMLFRHAGGKLTHWRTLAPGGGHGFGPRHVDFHPAMPWMYLSIERQNEIALFDMGDDYALRCRRTTLRDPRHEKPRQLVGAIHVHPDGRTVYVSNRADGTVEEDGRQVFNGAENTISVYAIDPGNGLPTLIQTADTYGMHPRTFQVHPEGRWLVAANMTPRWSRTPAGLAEVPAGLSVFAVGGDGRLEFRDKLDLDASRDHLFWAGFAALPA